MGRNISNSVDYYTPITLFYFGRVLVLLEAGYANFWGSRPGFQPRLRDVILARRWVPLRAKRQLPKRSIPRKSLVLFHSSAFTF